MNTLFGEEVIPVKVNKGAKFSEDRTHRFALWRIWDESKPLVMFIGLNPSTADEKENDQTIESVERLSKFNGYGGFYMMNCWSYISTDPNGLIHDNLYEAYNDTMLIDIARQCGDVIFAWGNFKVVADRGRDKELLKMFPGAKCINKNKNGSPGHPLYKKATIRFINY